MQPESSPPSTPDAGERRVAYEASKRAFDVACAGLGVILLSPVYVLTTLLIKLDSKGPVLYKGVRVGHRGKKFRIWKFRTMHPNAEALGTTTAKGDPRITRVGGFLRKYKLDELPQLFNVLRGEMSLVGPRPEVEEHTNDYNEEERRILGVKPGITDYSSIHFHNLGDLLGSENAHEAFLTRFRDEKNRLRLKYVYQRGFAEDLRILFLTFSTLFKKVGDKGQD